MSNIQIECPIWKAIMADDRLANARRKLSFHEIRLIIQHAKDARQAISTEGKMTEVERFTPVDLMTEQMGEALFKLSDSLRESGLLESDPIAAARYDSVVVAWRGLSAALTGGVTQADVGVTDEIRRNAQITHDWLEERGLDFHAAVVSSLLDLAMLRVSQDGGGPK
jgi:hypothetical protein